MSIGKVAVIFDDQVRPQADPGRSRNTEKFSQPVNAEQRIAVREEATFALGDQLRIDLQRAEDL